MKFAFLALAITVFFIPFLLNFNTRIFAEDNLKRTFIAALVGSVVFSSITIVLHLLGVLIYDYQNTSEVIFRGIPIEQYILHFSFSFTAVGIYLFLNQRFPNNSLQKYSLAFSNLLLGLCIAFIFFAYQKWYTVITFSVLLALLFLIEYVGNLRFMYKAYRSFAVVLLPFYLVYGTLFNLNVFNVNAKEIAGFSIFQIPIETHFTCLCTVLLSVYMFEFFKSQSSRNVGKQLH